MFKEPTAIVRNSLLAAVGFVDATLAVQQQSVGSTRSDHFDQELRDIAVTFLKEPLSDYRRWTLLTIAFLVLSLASLMAGVALAYARKVDIATLSSISSLLSGTISALLYKRLASAGSEVLKQLDVRGGKVA